MKENKYKKIAVESLKKTFLYTLVVIMGAGILIGVGYLAKLLIDNPIYLIPTIFGIIVGVSISNAYEDINGTSIIGDIKRNFKKHKKQSPKKQPKKIKNK